MAGPERNLTVYVVCKNVIHYKCLGALFFCLFVCLFFLLNKRSGGVSGIEGQDMNFVVT